MNHEQHPCKFVRVDKDGALENSTDVTKLLVDELSITMETTGCDASWLNVNNERHNRIIYTMVRTGLIDSDRHEKNGSVQQKHKKKSIYAISIVHYTTPHLTLYGMAINP